MLRVLGKSLIWTSSTFFFGLFQLWILFGNTKILKTFTISFDQILIDGSLLFFSTGLAASITTDYHLSDNQIKSKLFSSIIFVFFPIIIISTCTWLFTCCFGKNKLLIDLIFIRNAELVVLIMVGLYAFIAKIILFYLDIE